MPLKRFQCGCFLIFQLGMVFPFFPWEKHAHILFPSSYYFFCPFLYIFICVLVSHRHGMYLCHVCIHKQQPGRKKKFLLREKMKKVAKKLCNRRWEKHSRSYKFIKCTARKRLFLLIVSVNVYLCVYIFVRANHREFLLMW